MLRLCCAGLTTNTALINLDMSYHERKGRLSELAERERAK
nr:MAG TPA: hypothetical protein [Caudoviricetes sp.]